MSNILDDYSYKYSGVDFILFGNYFKFSKKAEFYNFD